MCVVSMVGDHYRDIWKEQPWYPAPVPVPTPYGPEPITITPAPQITINVPEISRREFDELKRQVLEMKELLKRAKKYDEDNGEPDCEIDDKMEVLRRVAKLVGVDLSDVIGDKHAPSKSSPA